MPGFFISNNQIKSKINNYYNERCIQEELVNKNYTIKRNTLNKFLDDKLFSEDEDCIIITEGVILNKRNLCSQMKNDFFSTVKSLKKHSGETFMNALRGSFSGAYYDKGDDCWIIYTSQFEDKPVFYYYSEGYFFVASSVNYIVDALKELNINYHLDEIAVYDLLTYGFMSSDRTLISEIKKIPRGCFLRFSDKSISIHQYHNFSNTENLMTDRSEVEIIDELDRLFREAIRLEYEKDLEYGYKHITSLSGGLDSRMNAWVANDMKYTNMLNICFSQSNYLDELIAKDISKHLGTELLIKTLDDGKTLTDFSEAVQMNFGLSLYSGITHCNSMNKCINFDNLGLIHTGQLGDVVIGSYSHKKHHEKARNLVGAYSTKLEARIEKKPDLYDNYELQALSNRGFRGVLASQIARSNFTELISPFLYLEFFEFCLRIPLEYRVNHNIYKKWISTKYPEAARFRVERFGGGYITDGKMKSYYNKFKMVGLKNSIIWVLKKVGFNINLDNRIFNTSMNPYDMWYYNKPEIKSFMDNYYVEKKVNENVTPKLHDDIVNLYENGTTGEKTQVLTALAAIDYYFNNKKH